jgi:two-component system response regulator RegX3
MQIQQSWEVGPTDHQDRSTWPKVLIVEDDESHILALTLGLEREGYAVTAVSDGRDAFDAVSQIQPDIILLDIMLPGMSGLDICRQLRSAEVNTPIIMVSSRNEEVDIVVGIEVGADDYVAKPYRIRELVARMNSVLRRHSAQPISNIHPPVILPTTPPADVLRVGQVMLDSGRHEVFVRDTKIDIPLREFQLLRELMEHAGRVVTREELIDNVWGFEYDGDPRIIATLVGRLRTKIEPDPDEPIHIITIRGVGYRFNDRY